MPYKIKTLKIERAFNKDVNPEDPLFWLDESVSFDEKIIQVLSSRTMSEKGKKYFLLECIVEI